MRVQGEPTLNMFSDDVGKRIKDLVYSLHSWRRSGRSRVSRSARHNEPKPAGSRRATPQEVYEHGRWRRCRSSKDINKIYQAWPLWDRLKLTLYCM